MTKSPRSSSYTIIEEQGALNYYHRRCIATKFSFEDLKRKLSQKGNPDPIFLELSAIQTDIHFRALENLYKRPDGIAIFYRVDTAVKEVSAAKKNNLGEENALINLKRAREIFDAGLNIEASLVARKNVADATVALHKAETEAEFEELQSRIDFNQVIIRSLHELAIEADETRKLHDQIAALLNRGH